MSNVMIMAAPNGGRRGKADHPAIPLTPAELAPDVAACAAAGAAAVHLHVRDTHGNHSLDPDLYREMLGVVRAAVPDIVIQVTTEALGRYMPAEQMETVRALRPAAASLALRELIPDASAEAEARAFFAWMLEAGVAPQIILYAPDEVTRCRDLVARGVIPFAAPFLLFVLGRYTAGQQSDPADLDPFVAALGDARFPWAMCAFGRREAACAVAAARLGGHVRIGFENNLHLPDGSLAPGNAATITAAATLLRDAGFGLMSAADARHLMGMRG
jgi:uncharacterized protein (DUF849 family)